MFEDPDAAGNQSSGSAPLASSALRTATPSTSATSMFRFADNTAAAPQASPSAKQVPMTRSPAKPSCEAEMARPADEKISDSLRNKRTECDAETPAAYGGEFRDTVLRIVDVYRIATHGDRIAGNATLYGVGFRDGVNPPSTWRVSRIPMKGEIRTG